MTCYFNEIKNLIDDVEVIDNQLNIKDYILGTQSANFENENYRKAVVRGAFLGAGSISVRLNFMYPKP